MAIQINYKKNNKKNTFTNLVLFVDEKFNILDLKSYIGKSDYNFIIIPSINILKGFTLFK